MNNNSVKAGVEAIQNWLHRENKQTYGQRQNKNNG